VTNTESGMVSETLDKLRALQDLLHKRHQVEQEILEIPRLLATKTELLSRLKKSYLERNEQLVVAGERIEQLRDEAIEAERTREGYEGQMDQIKTQREYEALDKEIQDSGEHEMELRRELQREEDQREEMQSALEKEELLIAKQEAEVSEEQARIKSEVAAREKNLADLKAQENDITPGLDEELLYKFERIVRSTEGLGIVSLQGNVCSGCYMTQPAHFVNRVRQGEDILFCTHGRIVFYQDEEPSWDDDSSEEPDEVFLDDDEMFEEEDEDPDSEMDEE